MTARDRLPSAAPINNGLQLQASGPKLTTSLSARKNEPPRILSQTNLTTWASLWPLFGLGELRFLHLDQSFLAAQQERLHVDCKHSPQLATL